MSIIWNIHLTSEWPYGLGLCVYLLRYRLDRLVQQYAFKLINKLIKNWLVNWYHMTATCSTSFLVLCVCGPIVVSSSYLTLTLKDMSIKISSSLVCRWCGFYVFFSIGYRLPALVRIWVGEKKNSIETRMSSCCLFPLPFTYFLSVASPFPVLLFLSSPLSISSCRCAWTRRSTWSTRSVVGSWRVTAAWRTVGHQSPSSVAFTPTTARLEPGASCGKTRAMLGQRTSSPALGIACSFTLWVHSLR